MPSRDVGNLRTKLSWEDHGAKSSLTGFREDLRGLKSEMNQLKARGREYTNSLRGLKRQTDTLNRTYRTQIHQARELRRRYRESIRVNGQAARETQRLARQYRNVRAQMSRTAGKIKDVNRAIENQINPWKKVGRNLQSTGQKMQDVGRSMSSTGHMMTMRVTAPILGIGAAAIKVATDFQASMSEVEAKTGATGTQMKALTKQARHLGATTKFSAKQAADGMTFLAQAGFSVNDIMKTMPAMLDLAASSNMDLGNAADIASNILTGFGMKASESGHMADVLSKAAASANTDVQQLGDGMKYAAPVASTLGLKIEGTTAAMEVMSNAGIQGQKAGRALRQGLLRLAKPTGQAARLIKKLGINVFDAHGNMKSMPNIVKNINNGLKGLDSKARAAALATIFGTNSTAGWSKVLDAGSGKVKSFTDQLVRSDGAAKKMADTMVDNTQGSLYEFKSALEEAGISISENLLPAFTDIVEGTTKMIRKFGNLDKGTQKTILKMAGLAAAIGPAALIAGNMTTAIGGITKGAGGLIKVLGKRGGGAGLIGRVAMMGAKGGVFGLAAVAAGGLAYGIYRLVKSNKKLEDVSLKTADSMTKQHDEQGKMIDQLDGLRTKSQLTNKEFGKYLDLLQDINNTTDADKIQKLKDQLEHLRKKSGLSNDQMKRMVDLNKKLTDKMPQATGQITEQGNRIADTTGKLKGYNKELAKATNRELETQRLKALKNQKQIEQEINDLIKKRNSSVSAEKDLKKQIDSYSQSETNEKIKQIEQDIKAHAGQKAYIAGQKIKLKHLREGKKGLIDQLLYVRKQTDGYNKQIHKLKTKKDKLSLINQKLASNYLVEAGISRSVAEQNVKKGTAINLVDKQIKKQKDNLSQLKKQTPVNDRHTDQYQKGVQKIKDQIAKLKAAKGQIIDITNKQHRENKAIDNGRGKAERLASAFGVKVTKGMRKAKGGQEGVNKAIMRGIAKAEVLNGRLSKSIAKHIKFTGDTESDAIRLNNALAKRIYKHVSVNVDVPAHTQINMYQAMHPYGHNAAGTDNWKGGLSEVAEQGSELVGYKGNWSLVKDRSLMMLQKGTQVIPHGETERIISQLRDIPKFASGGTVGQSSPSNDIGIMQEQLNKQSKMVDLLTKLVLKDNNVIIGEKEMRLLGKGTEPHVTAQQNRKQSRQRRAPRFA